MEKDVQEMYSQITGSIPVRTDIDLSDAAFTDGQREASPVLGEAVQAKRVVLSLAHNMAQPNQITAAMIDVLTEFVHNHTITPEQGQARLADGRGQRRAEMTAPRRRLGEFLPLLVIWLPLLISIAHVVGFTA